MQHSLDSLIAIEDLLQPEEKQARDSTRRFVNERYRPELTRAHREGTFPQHLIPELAGLGIFGAHLKGYGCAGMSNVAYGLVLQELERGDSGLRSVCSVQGSLVMHAIWAFGSELQKKTYLPKLAAGEMLGSFGLTEPGSGSDPSSMSTTAKDRGEYYQLDGVKTWITSSPICDLAVVWAKLLDEDNRIRGFIVERKFGGFATPTIDGKFSLRASPTGEIHLSECCVPKQNILPKSSGLRSPLSCLTQAREGISWGAIGAAMDCYQTVLEYGLQRHQFKKPLASFQLYQAQLAEMATAITYAQVANLHFGRLKDQGRLSAEQVSMRKRQNVRAARDIAQAARAMLGGNGVCDAYPVMRHMMNLESVYTYEGTHEIHTLALGRALTGISAFV